MKTEDSNMLNSPYYGLDVDEGDYLAREPLELPLSWSSLDDDQLLYDLDVEHDAHIADYLLDRAFAQVDALYS